MTNLNDILKQRYSDISAFNQAMEEASSLLKHAEANELPEEGLDKAVTECWKRSAHLFKNLQNRNELPEGLENALAEIAQKVILITGSAKDVPNALENLLPKRTFDTLPFEIRQKVYNYVEDPRLPDTLRQTSQILRRDGAFKNVEFIKEHHLGLTGQQPWKTLTTAEVIDFLDSVGDMAANLNFLDLSTVKDLEFNSFEAILNRVKPTGIKFNVASLDPTQILDYLNALPESVTTIDLDLQHVEGLDDKQVASIIAKVSSRLGRIYVEDPAVSKLDLSQATNLQEVTCFECSSLTSLTLPPQAPNLRGVTCHRCDQLGSLTLPRQAPNLLGVKCENCPRLASLTLPPQAPNLLRVTCKICGSLTSLTLPQQAPNLLGVACLECSSLTNLTLTQQAPSLQGVTCFECSSLTDLILPQQTPNLLEMTCEGCPNLTSLVLPWQTPKLQKVTCHYCNQLNLILPQNAPNLEEVSYRSCHQQTRLTLPQDAPQLQRVTCQRCQLLTDLILPQKAPNLLEVLCQNCPLVFSLTLPEDAPNLEKVSCHGCNQMHTLTLPQRAPNLDTIQTPLQLHEQVQAWRNARPHWLIQKIRDLSQSFFSVWE